jgi:uncharacterized membrane protein
MNLLEIRKNRIDNEIQEIREKRNIWLTTCLAFPPSILTGFAIVSKVDLGMVVAAIVGFLIYNFGSESIQKKLELKMNELKKLEATYKKDRRTS